LEKHKERQTRYAFPLQGAVSIETSYISFDDRFAAQIVYLAVARKGAGGFFGALDFSPLRHSPALAGREHYITKPPEWGGES